MVVLAVLIAAGAAFAAGTKPTLKLTGPSGTTLAHNAPYKVKISGHATQKANTVYAYEGGQVRGGTAAIQCYSTEQTEWAHYKPSAHVHVYLGHHAVSGNYTLSRRFHAVNPGPRSFCAYLTNASGSTTYAHAALHWTNSP